MEGFRLAKSNSRLKPLSSILPAKEEAGRSKPLKQTTAGGCVKAWKNITTEEGELEVMPPGHRPHAVITSKGFANNMKS